MKLRKKSVGLLAAAFAATMLMSGCGQVKIGYIEGSPLALRGKTGIHVPIEHPEMSDLPIIIQMDICQQIFEKYRDD